MNHPRKLIDIHDIEWLLKKKIESCIVTLRELRSADLTEKKLSIRVFVNDPKKVSDTKALTAECAIDIWADRAEYIDEKSFGLDVTQDEPAAPGCPDGPLKRITVHSDKPMQVPYITLHDMQVLENLLMQMLPRMEQEDAEPSRAVTDDKSLDSK